MKLEYLWNFLSYKIYCTSKYTAKFTGHMLVYTIYNYCYSDYITINKTHV